MASRIGFLNTFVSKILILNYKDFLKIIYTSGLSHIFVVNLLILYSTWYPPTTSPKTLNFPSFSFYSERVIKNIDVLWSAPRLAIDIIPALLCESLLLISFLNGFPKIDSPP